MDYAMKYCLLWNRLAANRQKQEMVKTRRAKVDQVTTKRIVKVSVNKPNNQYIYSSRKLLKYVCLCVRVCVCVCVYV